MYLPLAVDIIRESSSITDSIAVEDNDICHLADFLTTEQAEVAVRRGPDKTSTSISMRSFWSLIPTFSASCQTSKWRNYTSRLVSVEQDQAVAILLSLPSIQQTFTNCFDPSGMRYCLRAHLSLRAAELNSPCVWQRQNANEDDNFQTEQFSTTMMISRIHTNTSSVQFSTL